jgi:hypothetical protein
MIYVQIVSLNGWVDVTNFQETGSKVNIDSYHDLRSAFSFTLSVSGVKGDEFISDNGNHWDESLEPYLGSRHPY